MMAFLQLFNIMINNTPLWLAAMLVLNSTASLSGDLTGEVTDQSKSVKFQGAQVMLKELNQQVSTDDKGRFVFQDLPAGDYNVEVNYLGAASVTQTVTVDETGAVLKIRIGEDVEVMNNILVVGQAAGQAEALNKQKQADHFSSVISADAVGQLPDQNVTEALQRVAGVSITRDQGEGRFVMIRGLDPNLNAVSINGVSLPSAEAGDRQVALDVIPSDLIGEMTVSKSARADKDADGLGGSIDIKSLSAFDRGERSMNVRIEGSYNDLEGEYSPKFSGSFTQLFSVGEGYDNFGVAASVSHFDRSFGSDNLETDGPWTAIDLPTGGETILPEEAEQRDYTINRKRSGLALNFDYKPTEQSNFYLRTLFSDFEDDERRLRNEVKFNKGELVSVSGNRYDFDDVEVQKELKSRLETQTIHSLVFGGEHMLGVWDIDYALGYSKAKEQEPNRLDVVFEGEVSAGMGIGGGSLYDVFHSADGLDVANYELKELEFTNNLTEDKQNSLEMNFKRDIQWGNESHGHVKMGLKLRNREKYNDENITIYDGFGEDYTLADFQGPAIGYFGQIGPVVDQVAFRRFVNENRSGFEVDGEGTRISDLGADYQVDEDVSAAYLMAKWGNGRSQWSGGLRLEQTDFFARGVRVTIDEQVNDGDASFTDIVVNKDYSDVLPSLNFKHELTNNTLIRAAAYRSLVRPNFGDVAPLEVFEIEEDDGEIERKAEVGNPDLKPLTANGFDLAIEYYSGDIGVFSAGFFYKDIQNFVVMADVSGVDEYADFDEVIKPLNGDDAELYGLEFNWVQRMHFLPGAWDGLLLSANYTYTDASAKLSFRDGDFRLPRQSENVANVAIGYEKYGWSLRAAWSYRDEFLDEISEFDDPSVDRYVDGHLQFDVSAKYQFNNRYQFYFEGINLNDEPLHAYFGRPDRNAQYESYGWTAQVGMRIFLD